MMANYDQTPKSELPAPVAKRGLDEAQWRTLSTSLYPGARPQSIMMVVDYCKARKLDPLKHPCHIVPMRQKDAQTGEYVWRDVVMPGIYEYRMTAQRTGEYLGHSVPEYGPYSQAFGVEAPEWCAMTIYRWNPRAKVSTEFPVRVYFKECASTKKKDIGTETVELANDRWRRAPVQMLTKVCEAAGLREAFPDELGGEYTAEEMEGQDQYPVRDVTPRTKPVVAMPQERCTAPVEPEQSAPAPSAPDVTAAEIQEFVQDMKAHEAETNDETTKLP